MKSISVIAILTTISFSAFAKEAQTAKTQDVAPLTEETVAASQPADSGIIYLDKQNTESKAKETSNPKTKFPRGMQIGLGISPTSGLNGFIGYNNKNFNSFWAKRFGVRFDFATYSPIKSKMNSRINDALGDEGMEIDDNLKVDNVDLSAKHFGALVDFYPFGNTWFLGGLRLSGGYMTGKLDLNADIQGTKKVGKIEFELGGNKYTYDGDVMHGKADVNWKYSGPYLGAGFDLGLFWGIKIYMDAGVVFTGNSAQISLDIPYNDLKDINGTPIDPNSSNPIVQTAVTNFKNAKKEALSEAQKELDKYDFYPLVKLGFMYRF